MRYSRIALIAASVFAVACANEETTSPLDSTPADTRLAAVAAPPTSAMNDPMVSLTVSVTSALGESVTGGVCAERVEARPVTSSNWTNVTSTLFACSAMAVILQPGGTIQLSAVADPSKIRAAAGQASTVVLRARSTLTGASTTYTLQSNEVTWQLP